MNTFKIINSKLGFNFHRILHKNFSSNTSNNLVKIKYDELINTKDNESYLFDCISKAYNKDGLGILIIEKVPKIIEKKNKLFELSHKLVNLHESELKKVEKPDLNFTIGWSYGKEYLSSKPDLLKASYYARLRPLTDKNTIKEKNIWPEVLPELHDSFHSVGNQIREVGLIILKNIDAFIRKNYPSYNLNYPQIISDSCENTGRLLYYFPRNKIKNEEKVGAKNENFENAETNWCEWHNDHGSLTGLVSASYLNEDGSEAKGLNLTKTGLFVQNRKGEIIRISYGPEDLAFQLGETLQIHSGGLLHATPHAVKFMEDSPSNIARTTFALFMEPNKDFKLNFPQEKNKDDIRTHEIYKYIPKLQDRFDENMSFGEFCDRTNALYYKMNNK